MHTVLILSSPHPFIPSSGSLFSCPSPSHSLIGLIWLIVLILSFPHLPHSSHPLIRFAFPVLFIVFICCLLSQAEGDEETKDSKVKWELQCELGDHTFSPNFYPKKPPASQCRLEWRCRGANNFRLSGFRWSCISTQCWYWNWNDLWIRQIHTYLHA